jgi:tRNA dimethylallyltransferase
MEPRPVLILSGPTASGKTELALALAERLDAEIVGADSRQIYAGMPIGTAAPLAAERERVPHHLVGFLAPHERYSAARFVDDALAAIAAIHARGRRALVVGGTGFYIRALCGDVALAGMHDPSLRARLAAEARIHPAPVLHDWLAALAPARAAAISPNDPYRVARALEIALGGRATRAAEEIAPPRSLRSLGIPFVKIWLEIDGAELDRRIAARVERMLAAGLLEEAERIGAGAVAADAVGYPQALAFLAGWSNEAELRAALVRATRRYAKRQKTWFAKEPGLVRVPAAGADRRLEALARESLARA